MTDNISDRIYPLLKKRFNDLIDLYVKESGSFSVMAIADERNDADFIRIPSIDQLWWNYLDEIGCSRHHSSYILDILDHLIPGIEDHVICVNPMSNFMGYIAVPKEIALKAIVVGEFPEISFEVRK